MCHDRLSAAPRGARNLGFSAGQIVWEKSEKLPMPGRTKATTSRALFQKTTTRSEHQSAQFVPSFPRSIDTVQCRLYYDRKMSSRAVIVRATACGGGVRVVASSSPSSVATRKVAVGAVHVSSVTMTMASRSRGMVRRDGLALRVHAESSRKAWWESVPLPRRVKDAAKEIEFFGGSPLQQILPWMSVPKATAPGRPDPTAAGVDKSLLLFDFTEGSPDADSDRFSRVWGALNDVVMGGQSEAAATLVTIPQEEGGKCAKLSGVVEGEGGGFVSMRTRNFLTPLDLEDYDGIKMRLRGDGRRYKLILRDVEDFFALSFHVPFDTVEGEWKELVGWTWRKSTPPFDPVVESAQNTLLTP